MSNTVIGNSITIEGEITSDEALVVQGNVFRHAEEVGLARPAVFREVHLRGCVPARVHVCWWDEQEGTERWGRVEPPVFCPRTHTHSLAHARVHAHTTCRS